MTFRLRRDKHGRWLDPDALDVLRRALLDGRNPDDVVYTFGRLDPGWLADNAAKVIAREPSLTKDVAYVLRKLPEPRLAATYRAMAAVSPDCRSQVLEVIQERFEGKERDRLLRELQ